MKAMTKKVKMLMVAKVNTMTNKDEDDEVTMYGDGQEDWQAGKQANREGNREKQADDNVGKERAR